MDSDQRGKPGRRGKHARNRDTSRAAGGLRLFSLKVVEKISLRVRTTYNAVANELVVEQGGARDGKSVRRRCYDAINVLLACGLIKRDDRKQIVWRGHGSVELDRLRTEVAAKRDEVERKRQALQELEKQQKALESLLERNANRSLSPEAGGETASSVCTTSPSGGTVVTLPFWLLQAGPDVKRTPADDRSSWEFELADRPLQLHDDSWVLQQLHKHALERPAQQLPSYNPSDQPPMHQRQQHRHQSSLPSQAAAVAHAGHVPPSSDAATAAQQAAAPLAAPTTTAGRQVPLDKQPQELLQRQQQQQNHHQHQTPLDQQQQQGGLQTPVQTVDPLRDDQAYIKSTVAAVCRPPSQLPCRATPMPSLPPLIKAREQQSTEMPPPPPQALATTDVLWGALVSVPSASHHSDVAALPPMQLPPLNLPPRPLMNFGDAFTEQFLGTAPPLVHNHPPSSLSHQQQHHHQHQHQRIQAGPSALLGPSHPMDAMTMIGGSSGLMLHDHHLLNPHQHQHHHHQQQQHHHHHQQQQQLPSHRPPYQLPAVCLPQPHADVKMEPLPQPQVPGLLEQQHQQQLAAPAQLLSMEQIDDDLPPLAQLLPVTADEVDAFGLGGPVDPMGYMGWAMSPRLDPSSPSSWFQCRPDPSRQLYPLTVGVQQ